MTANQITFTIPFYKNEILLKKTIESALSQSVTHWRLIISLDSELSESFVLYLKQLSDSRIKTISNSNNGICGNWNNCINATESNYVTILHSDDELLPNYIETMMNLIQDKPDCAFYFCDAQIIGINSRPVFSFADKVKSFIQPRGNNIYLKGDSGLADLLKGCFIFCPSICYKTEVIKKYQFRDKWQMVLDLDLYSRLLMDGHQLVGTSTRAYRYRRHDNNQTAKLTKGFRRFDEELMLYDELAIKAKKLDWLTTYKVASKKKIIKMHLVFLFVKSLCCFKLKRAKSILQYFIFNFTS